jgi:hypothetical protein
MKSEKKPDFASSQRRALGIFLTFFALVILLVILMHGWRQYRVFIFILWIYAFAGVLAGKMQIVPILGKLYQNIFKVID